MCAVPVQEWTRSRHLALKNRMPSGEVADGFPDHLQPHWVGGLRTSLSDSYCAQSPVPRWPYFTPGTSNATVRSNWIGFDSGQEARDYAGCGKGTVEDWAWRSWTSAQGGAATSNTPGPKTLPWRQVEGVFTSKGASESTYGNVA
jgi:hypothetical protein